MSQMEPSQRMLLTVILLLITLIGCLAVRLCIGKVELTFLQGFGIAAAINLVVFFGMWLGQVTRPFR